MCHIVNIKKIDLYIVTDTRKDSKIMLLNMYDLSDCCRDRPNRNQPIVHLSNSNSFHLIQSIEIKSNSNFKLPSYG